MSTTELKGTIILATDTSAKVGIGKTSPAYALDVSGQIQVKSLSKHGSRFYPIEEVGAQGNITIGACFPSSGLDIAGRRVCDIYGGFTGYAWNTEFMSFGVGTGDTNNVNNPTTERFRINGGANTVVTIGQRYAVGTAADSTTLGLERSRHTINFAGYHDADVNRMGASISCINKQTWGGAADRTPVQSGDLVFSVAPISSGGDPVERMRITDAGYVGIGTTAPTCPLYVGTSVNMGNTIISPIAGAWFNNSGGVFATSYGGTFFGNFLSIYALNNIQSGGSFISTSDRRIKANIIDVEDDRALRDLRLLKPKTYTYKDVNTRGTEPVYGFIAQEVKEVLNYASSLNKDTIPNIYELATFSTDILTLTFNTEDLARDASGALFTKLKVKTRELKDEFVNIVEVLDTNTIKVDKDLTEWGGQLDASGQVVPGNQIFVYGQEVDDFHTLNKDAIWTVATAALQEVDRQLQAEKQKTADLTSVVSDLQSTLALALTRLDALEQKP